MALSRPLYVLFRQALRERLLPQNGSLLEFGEANWYGDMPVEALIADINGVVTNPAQRDALVEAVRTAAAHDPPDLFAIAKAAYASLFNPSVVHAIDLHGSPSAFALDLNEPIALDGQYDVTINNGTAEHIFNIGQFFRTVHERTKPGGLMVHDAPFTGWVDHGFYTLQPTLFIDVARANGYDILAVFVIDWESERLEHIPDHAALLKLVKTCSTQASTNLVIFVRKPATERPFVVPRQGYYADTLSADARRVWHERR